MTPGELGKIKAAVAEAVAALLARDTNESITAEQLADEVSEATVETVIDTYEALQAKNYNLVIVASFRMPEGNVHTAAVGPLSTRAVQRARDLGEKFAWDYKSRTGEGVFTLVPLVRDPRDAWDEARNADLDEYTHALGSITPRIGQPSYEPMRLELSDATRGRITADWQMDPEILRRKLGPHCLCGHVKFPERTNLGDGVTRGCPLHPEKVHSEQQAEGGDT